MYRGESHSENVGKKFSLLNIKEEKLNINAVHTNQLLNSGLKACDIFITSQLVTANKFISTRALFKAATTTVSVLIQISYSLNMYYWHIFILSTDTKKAWML